MNITEEKLKRKEKIPEFIENDITTTTYILYFKEEVNLEAVFSFLEIIKIRDIKKEHLELIENNKCAPFMEEHRGKILSATYPPYHRGIVIKKYKDGDGLKNAIGLSIYLDTKIVNAKLSKKKLQITGAKNKLHASETYNIIKRNIQNAIDNLAYIQDNIELAKESMEWLLSNTKQERYIFPIEIVIDKNKNIADCKFNNFEKNIIDEECTLDDDISDIIIHESENGYYIDNGYHIENKNNIENNKNKEIIFDYVIKRNFIKDHGDIPDYIDKRIVNFLFSFSDDYDFHEDLEDYMKICMRNVKLLYGTEFGIYQILSSMQNFTFDVGFKINKLKMKNYMKALGNFYPIYCPCSIKSFRLKKEYEVPLHEKEMRKKKENHCFTIMVNSSGKMTLSGPGLAINKKFYNIFIEDLKLIAHLI